MNSSTGKPFPLKGLRVTQRQAISYGGTSYHASGDAIVLHIHSLTRQALPVLMCATLVGGLLNLGQAEARTLGCEMTDTDTYKKYLGPGWRDIA